MYYVFYTDGTALREDCENKQAAELFIDSLCSDSKGNGLDCVINGVEVHVERTKLKTWCKIQEKKT